MVKMIMMIASMGCLMAYLSACDGDSDLLSAGLEEPTPVVVGDPLLLDEPDPVVDSEYECITDTDCTANQICKDHSCVDKTPVVILVSQTPQRIVEVATPANVIATNRPITQKIPLFVAPTPTPPEQEPVDCDESVSLEYTVKSSEENVQTAIDDILSMARKCHDSEISAVVKLAKHVTEHIIVDSSSTEYANRIAITIKSSDHEPKRIAGHYVNGFKSGSTLVIVGSNKNVSVNLENIEITRGAAELSGGCVIVRSAELMLKSSKIIGCSAVDSGGAIYSEWSTVRVIDSVIEDNKAKFGGGIYSTSGYLEITGSSIRKNTADGWNVDGAGGVVANDTSFRIIRSDIIENDGTYVDNFAYKLHGSDGSALDIYVTLSNICGEDDGSIYTLDMRAGSDDSDEDQDQNQFCQWN